MRSRLAPPLAFLLDLVVLASVAALLLLFVTGGGAVMVAGVRIRVTSPRHPAMFCFFALARYIWLADVPVFGWFAPRALERPANWLLAGVVDPLRRSRARALLAGTIGISAALRLANAIVHPGFSTGDDVEIHVMSLGRLLGHAWPSWNLRNALYPMLFVYPAQVLAYGLGIVDVQMLVLAGRLVVVAVATLTIYFVYRIATRLTGDPMIGAIAAALVAISRLHLWFGGSEFPRPVAAAFVTGALLLLMNRGSSPGDGAGTAPRNRRRRTIVAGVLLGIGGSLRFGELAFIVPAALHLAWERRRREAVVVTLAAVAAAALCLGVADWWYWGTPFYSLKNIFVYTIVQGQSSRGFQPPWYYVTELSKWTNWIVIALAIAGTRRSGAVALWAWVPLLVLSALPHKEPRYLIPVLPFLAIAAACGASTLATWRSGAIPSFAVALALGVALASELSAWRFVRTDAGVRLAQIVDRMRPPVIAVQQVWRFGGPLYWADVPAIVELPESAVDVAAIPANVDTVVLVRELIDDHLLDEMMSAGFHVAATTPGYVALRR
jgi:hypothetical protein